MKAGTLWFALVLVPNIVGAGQPTGLEMLKNCEGIDTRKAEWTAQHGFCNGFLVGLIQGTPAEQGFCLPSGTTYEQLQLVVNGHLDDNPATLHQSAVKLYLLAFKDAFPCPAPLK